MRALFIALALSVGGSASSTSCAEGLCYTVLPERYSLLDDSMPSSAAIAAAYASEPQMLLRQPFPIVWRQFWIF